VESIAAYIQTPEEDNSPLAVWLKRGLDSNPWIGLIGINLYDDIASLLPEDQSLLAMHVPERRGPAGAHSLSVADLAALYVREIRQQQPKGPYYLFGLCYAGIVAFEAAAQLEEQGERVALVAILDGELPRSRHFKPGRLMLHVLETMVTDPPTFLAKARARMSILFPPSRKPQPDDGSRSTAADNRAEEDVQIGAPELGGDLSAYQSLGRRIAADLLVFRTAESDGAPWLAIDQDLGWGGRAERVFTYRIPSSHLGIVRHPYAQVIVDYFVEARKRALAQGDR
jgi:thioesterase domain-containing protein